MSRHPEGFGVEERSLVDCAAAMAAGLTTSLELVDGYLERIERLDRNGPALASVIERNPDARTHARDRDRERANGMVRGPLHGVPILLKDNIDTGDRMFTSAGSLALAGHRAPRDADIVRSLRKAGAVLLGKTNLSEWANLRGRPSLSGWSARGGLTRNPYALDRSASGSSSGSAVAVAASLCAGAIGTETDGSILCPASVCGVVGMKPTLGLLSTRGIVPVAQSQDCPGPMARSVADCAALLQSLAAGGSGPGSGPADYMSCLGTGALRGARLGVLRQFFAGTPALQRTHAAVLQSLERAGATLVDSVELPALPELRVNERIVLLNEFRAGIDAYLRHSVAYGSHAASLAEVVAFNRRWAASELAWFGQDLMEEALRMAGPESAEFRAARAHCHRIARREGIEAVLDAHGLDALIAPTTGPAWTIERFDGDPPAEHSCSYAAVAGTPGITVPAAMWRGLPLGLSFYGRRWSERRLLSLACDFEAVAGARNPPTYATTLTAGHPALDEE